jgi:hypothetical protein
LSPRRPATRKIERPSPETQKPVDDTTSGRHVIPGVTVHSQRFWVFPL